MAAVTLLGSSFNTTSGTHTVTATPAVGDLIVIIAAHTGSVSQAAPTDNNSGGAGTYTQAQNALKATSADIVGIWVRDALIASATSTVFTLAPGTTTGGGLAVLKVTGMTLSGLSAKRQSGSQANQAAATPAPVMGGVALTANPVIGAVFNATNSATMTPRTGYTEHVDTGYATPTTGIEIMSLDSGETAQTITWGSASASAFCSVVVELDTTGITPKKLAAMGVG